MFETPGIGIGSQTIFRGEGWSAGQQTGIAAVDASTVDTTYGQEEDDVITDLRTKVDALINKLETLGLLATA